MKRKVVYNDCYGGYELSDAAVELLNQRGYEGDSYDLSYSIPRDNEDLVAVVEELGDKASGMCSKLRVRELSEDAIAYKIEEYDGYEKVVAQYLDEDYVILNQSADGYKWCKSKIGENVYQLPKISGGHAYLVHIEGYTHAVIGNFYHDHWMINHEKYSIDDVIHWTEIPKLPN